ncbi:hypothetical protein RB595_010315 [Gaeumannomyces hyphopodioides]
MDRSSTAESKHPYPTTPWPHLAPVATAPRTDTVASPTAEGAGPLFSASLDLLPILFPHQSVYQTQLLNYNKLIATGRRGGGGLQNSPHSPSGPTNHAHPGPRSRSSSKVSNKDAPSSKPNGNQNCHGNRLPKNTDKADRAVIAGKEPAATTKMPSRQADGANQPSSYNSSRQTRQPQQNQQPRPPPAQASSVPSTPHQHARNFSFESREHSPTATQNHSPRSTYSDPNGNNMASLRPLPPRLGGCVFETAMIRGRRRMPYSLGGDRLDPVEPGKIKNKLSEDEERKLTTDMRELYDRLKPTDKVKENRAKLVKKLDRIFNEGWPGHNIRVHLFGSSGNKLCSDDSDVDICITTDWKELENVCMIADLLRKRGMDKVVCVSSAKVPIVKAWDPELQLACDMNVNNTLALENTRMVLTYVDIDERVRPLAMVIKHWTRRRIINDAAFGGTLSSYTWICMIIAFLQLRSPPILPSLHLSPHKKILPETGRKSEFADDISKLRGFGEKNKETLGELLFHFFRFYAHEFDYDKWALSVRLGKKITKTEKKWHLALNNMLCVEEPFNTVRNLGNTADDTSFRGLHQELRRAFELVAEAKLDECCEQYVFPKEEERVWQKPAAAPRPVLVRSSSQQHGNRGGRGNYRGNRSHRGNNRRASSSVTYDNNPNPILVPATGFAPTMGQDGQWYASPVATAQYPYVTTDALLNPALFAGAALQYDPNLRFQLYSQQLAQQQAIANMQQRLSGVAAQQQQQGQQGQQSTDRSRAGSFDQPPLSAPVRPEFTYIFPQISLGPQYFPAGYTYPSSPASAAANTPTAASEFRRSLHRNTVAGEAGGSSSSGTLRSQSQPASRSPMSSATTQGGVGGYPVSSQAAVVNGIHDYANGVPVLQARQANGMPVSFVPSDDAVDTDYDGKSSSDSPPPQEEGATGYLGYYVSDGTSPVKKQQPKNSSIPNGVPNGVAFGDLGQGLLARRRLSTDQSPQSILDRRMRRTSRSPSPLGHARAYSAGTGATPVVSSSPLNQTTGNASKLSIEARPLVVNGSVSKLPSSATSSRQPSASESTTSETCSIDTPLHSSQSLGMGGYTSPLDKASVDTTPTAVVSERPLVVNGSTTPSSSPLVAQNQIPDAKSFNQRIAAMNSFVPSPVNQRIMAMGAVDGGISPLYPISPAARTRNGIIAPLDLAVPQGALLPDVTHLSPVYETRTPSPTMVRKFDGPAAHGLGGANGERPSPPVVVSSKDFQSDASKAKTRPENGVQPPRATGNGHGSPKDSGQARIPSRIDTAVPNGGNIDSASASGGGSGWQKTKSRKKPSDTKSLTNGLSHGEQLPKNEADRKGG